MEGTERKLRTRLADRLCGDDTDSFAHLDDLVRREVTAVALRAYATAHFAGKYRTNEDGLDRSRSDLRCDFFADHSARFEQNILRERVDNVIERYATENTLGERLLHVFSLFQRADRNATDRTAIEC